MMHLVAVAFPTLLLLFALLLKTPKASCFVANRRSSYYTHIEESRQQRPHLQTRRRPSSLYSHNSYPDSNNNNNNNHAQEQTQQQQQSSSSSPPFPVMPSPLFINLAQSQLELLAHSLHYENKSKIGSMALYLPQENSQSGQLEFVPAVLYPDPSSERVFIAHTANSGVAPTLPKTLTKLPGFSHAAALLPGYPMVSNSGVGVGVVEEVMCDATQNSSTSTTLSVPLFSGSRTVGVLLVWPEINIQWTIQDKEQIQRAAQSLSLALSMDVDRTSVQNQVNQVRVALSDSLHQVKNPLQALRTFGKLLQQRVANSEEDESTTSVPQLLALAQHLMVQSDRVTDLLLPMDSIVSSLEEEKLPLYLSPAKPPEQTSLTPWRFPQSKPWNDDPIFDLEQQQQQRSNSEAAIQNGTMPFVHKMGPNEPQEQPPPSSLADSSTTTPTTSSSTTSSTSSMLGSEEELEMCFCTDVLDPILVAFGAMASEKGIDFEVVGKDEELPGVLVCPKALQEAVSNVLDNAFKYALFKKTKNGSFIANPNPRVRVRFAPNSNKYAAGVTVTVEDNGPGIQTKDKEAVFERGFRSDATSSVVEGTGIGLDITRSLLARMGGLIHVVEQQQGTNRGTTMEFVLFRQPELPS